MEIRFVDQIPFLPSPRPEHTTPRAPARFTATEDMSSVSAAQVARNINNLDNAIRQGLSSGKIADVMEEKKAELVSHRENNE